MRPNMPIDGARRLGLGFGLRVRVRFWVRVRARVRVRVLLHQLRPLLGDDRHVGGGVAHLVREIQGDTGRYREI